MIWNLKSIQNADSKCVKYYSNELNDWLKKEIWQKKENEALLNAQKPTIPWDTYIEENMVKYMKEIIDTVIQEKN